MLKEGARADPVSCFLVRLGDSQESQLSSCRSLEKRRDHAGVQVTMVIAIGFQPYSLIKPFGVRGSFGTLALPGSSILGSAVALKREATHGHDMLVSTNWGVPFVDVLNRRVGLSRTKVIISGSLGGPGKAFPGNLRKAPQG